MNGVNRFLYRSFWIDYNKLLDDSAIIHYINRKRFYKSEVLQNEEKIIAVIAQACYLNSTPFVIIRAISDKPDETENVNYKTFEAKAAERCAKIVRYIVENGSTD